MIRRACTYHNYPWHTLLEDFVDETQSQELAGHLESCEECRQKFEELAAPSEWWRETTSLLTLESTTLDTKPAVKLSDVSQGIRWQAYLQSSPKDGSLGRIGLYSIQRVLGSGGMGVVFEAFDPSLHRTVAIKVMHPHFAILGAARQRFAREARAAAAVVHPNVVPIHAVVADADLPYLVMTYVPGESLQERLDREGHLPFEDCLSIALQIADGLAAAHALGLVHRDIKPANILLEQGTSRVWLTDFGLARTLDDATVTASGFIAGTPQFMSPEQASGDAVDHRSDLFSLGSVLYTMIAGRPPFRAESSLAVLRRIADQEPRRLNEIRSETPLWLEAVVACLQNKTLDRRFGQAALVRDILRQCALHLSNPQQVPLPEEVLKLQRSLQQQLNQQRNQRSTTPGMPRRMIFGCLIALGCIALLWVVRPKLFTAASVNANSAIGVESSGAQPKSQGMVAAASASKQVSPLPEVNVQVGSTTPLQAKPPFVGESESTFQDADLRSIDAELRVIRQRIEGLQFPFFNGVRETHD